MAGLNAIRVSPINACVCSAGYESSTTGKSSSASAQAALLRRVDGKIRQAGEKSTEGFFPRIDLVTVYAITVERMTGKEQSLPPLSEHWPAKDRTKTPNALLPN